MASPATATVPQGHSLAHRPTTGLTSNHSDDEAVPETDPTDTTSLLLERLRAYKHACGYLEAYVTATEKVHKDTAKEYSRVLKSVSDPLREGNQFDQSLGGVAGLFENIRSNTQGLINSHAELEKSLKGTVLPILERLHVEIKNKTKELEKGAGRASKEVSKARNSTQAHIELLGQHTASFSSAGGKVDSVGNDPYLIQRGIRHRLHQQVQAENNNRHDIIAVQESFKSFEAHVIQTFQQALNTFYQYVGGQSDRAKNMYGDITATGQRMPVDFEWNAFVGRYNDILIDPKGAPRDFSSISFPNENHPSTQPLIAGTLERKSRVALKGYDTGYFVVTPSKFLHEFKDDDDLRRNPTPELSLFLPDCLLGGVSGEKFTVKGKDVSKGKVGSAMAIAHELSFKAHTNADAEKWWVAIEQAAKGSAGAPVDTPATTTVAVPEKAAPATTTTAPAAPAAVPAQQPAPITTAQPKSATGYQASPITPGAGVQPGTAGPAQTTGVIGGAGTAPAITTATTTTGAAPAAPTGVPKQ